MAVDTLGKLIRTAIDERLAGLHVSVPARIKSYNAATQRAAVEPMAHLRSGADEIPLPIIDDVPVCWPRAGGVVVILPLAVDDVVQLFFNDRILDDWRGTGAKVEPRDPRSHALTDAFAVPMGIWPDAQAAASGALAGTDVVIARDGGGCIAIKADGTVVVGDVVGGVVAQPVALAPLVSAQLASLLPALQALSAAVTATAAGAAALSAIGANAAAVPATGAATAAAGVQAAAVAALAAWPATMAATKAKAV